MLNIDCLIVLIILLLLGTEDNEFKDNELKDNEFKDNELKDNELKDNEYLID